MGSRCRNWSREYYGQFTAKPRLEGHDKGRYIIASPDGLGFEEPRIFVEVKHRGRAMGAPEIRSLVGGLRGKDHDLYLSTVAFPGKPTTKRKGFPFPLRSQMQIFWWT
jgi:predicted Mrr-cat superfamily restriction endonuclease